MTETREQFIDRQLSRLRAVMLADFETIVTTHQHAFPTAVTKEVDDKTRNHYEKSISSRLKDIETVIREACSKSNASDAVPRRTMISQVCERLFGDKTPEEKRIHVGVGVLVIRGEFVVRGVRKGSLCPGQVALPGGHLEYSEGFDLAAIREVRQETGLEIKVRPYDKLRTEWYVTHNLLPKNGRLLHYVGAFVVADYVSGELETKEKDKNEGYTWVKYDDLVNHAKPGDAWLPTEFIVDCRARLDI